MKERSGSEVQDDGLRMAMAHRSDMEELVAEAREAIAAAPSAQALAEVRAGYLGRQGSVAALLRGIGALPPEERGRAGQAANTVKERIEALVEERRAALLQQGQARALSEHRLDVTLPAAHSPFGHRHPVSQVMRNTTAFFRSLGFSVVDGPEVETDYHNFTALNFPLDHPSRDTQDTFFVEGGNLLRTQTSTVQIRAMSGHQPPFRFISLGRVYRNDSDATHSPMFHQVEGVMVDERVTFGDLKGVLFAYARHLMGSQVDLRFRAHYFPFTEPSAELDFSWQGQWLEWGGCGMIHPQVLRNCGIDAARYQGFAFGMGIDRSAMLRFGLPHIQLLFDGDVRVLEQV